jgi:tRNA threonylcarbamoyladenosine dehydratase
VRKLNDGSREIAIGLKTPITLSDIAFLVEEVYRGRSAVTGIPTKLVLVRWKRPSGSTLIRIGEGENEQKSSNLRLGDLVAMTKAEAVRHEKEVLLGGRSPEDFYDTTIIEKIEARLKEAEAYEKFR